MAALSSFAHDLVRKPFPLFGILRHCRARPGAKPLEPFGKGSNALKAGTPDAGPESPTVQERASARPSVQPPAGVERKRALYAAYLERQGHDIGPLAERVLVAICCLRGPARSP